MPNNTWLTPYIFPQSKCLSLGPSQGIVYQICDEAVIKVPFQYPVIETRLANKDEIDDQIGMSLQSFALFKKECAFYAVLAQNQHPNLLQRLQITKLSGIVLPRLMSLEQAWGISTGEMHLTWIRQLLNVDKWLEELGYTHGDWKIQNMGIDGNSQLKVFDFGAVRHRTDEDFYAQVVEDHFTLATCIHFLASGVDPLAKARTYTDVQKTLCTLREGRGIVDEAAKDFERVIQAGWTGAVSMFSTLRQTLNDTAVIETKGSDQVSESLREILDNLILEHDPRWLNEEAYRAAWKAAGYHIPDDIWS